MAFADRVTLPFHSFRWSGQSGDFGGQGSGSSMDFQDHRDYAPGDDPRHINWQAYARSGNYILKQYREEVAPTVDLILDISASMLLTEEKQQRTCELFYLISACAYKSGAQLHTHLIAGAHYYPVSNEEVRSGAWAKYLTDPPKSETTTAPDVSLIPMKAGSLRILISDLLFAGDPVSVLRPLQARKGALFCFAPYLESEVSPDWAGNYEFQDVESQQTSPYKIDPLALKNYKAAYQRHFSLWSEAVQANQAKLARVSAELPLSDALTAEAIPYELLQYSS